MKGKYYTDERNIQILIFLLKANGIKRIVASPGATNVTFVGSIQQDPFFEIYSSVDERSAAYMACGLAFETGEPVVLSCTGATASRNYMPGLTEAFYRKLPVLAVTSTQNPTRIGHYVPQVIDRRSHPNDIVLLSEHIQTIKDDDDEWDVNVKVNRALLELRHNGGGPVHINLETTYSRNFEVEDLPSSRVIHRITTNDKFPTIPQGKIGVFIGNHRPFSKEETTLIEHFCESNNAVVFVDHTSNYKGKYKVLYSLAANQMQNTPVDTFPTFVIHIGEVSGDYTFPSTCCNEVWRISADGKIIDRFKKLMNVFEMSEAEFFSHYSNTGSFNISYFQKCERQLNFVRTQIPDLPFSNLWVAQNTADRFPDGSIVHLSILNTLRCWNFFEMPTIDSVSCNTGAFGIDGILSTLVGASLANKEKLHFVVIGDLAFFYDMNALGNRHIGKNVRVLLINNGKGIEFRNYDHPANAFQDEADMYMAAAGHFGCMSPNLVKHYAEDLGFEYLSANSKEQYQKIIEKFLSPAITDKPMLAEVFTLDSDESEALKMIRNASVSASGVVKNMARNILGSEGTKMVKQIFHRNNI